MDELGNLLTLCGITVTFASYLSGHQGVSVRHLEPTVFEWISRASSVLHRVLRRPTQVAWASGGPVAGVTAATGAAYTWKQVLPTNEIEVRTDKLEYNLVALRDVIDEINGQFRDRLALLEMQLALGDRALRGSIADIERARLSGVTSSMRWELRGLLLALIGAAFNMLS